MTSDPRPTNNRKSTTKPAKEAAMSKRMSKATAIHTVDSAAHDIVKLREDIAWYTENLRLAEDEFKEAMSVLNQTRYTTPDGEVITIVEQSRVNIDVDLLATLITPRLFKSLCTAFDRQQYKAAVAARKISSEDALAVETVTPVTQIRVTLPKTAPTPKRVAPAKKTAKK